MQIQRARILTAMFDLASEHGAARVSVADVVERSGVSRRTFYEVFTDREDCFLAAFEDALAFATQRVLPAYQAEHGWREQIRAGVVAFLSFLDEEPVIGCLLIRESSTGSTRIRREQILAEITSAIDRGREEHTNTAALMPPSLTAEGLVGGVLSILDARLSLPGDSHVIALANTLLSMIVLPYLGPATARKELDRPIEQPRVSDHHDARLLEDPFKASGMRLTYRTVRVLLTVAEHPGASNRTIGESAGITDQGQTSKLLARLERLGLISNSGLGPGLGAPNAWTLTETGRQLTNSIRTHTENHK